MGKGSNNKLTDTKSASSRSQAQTSGAVNVDKSNVYFSREEVRKHDKKDDCWIIVNENVYNITQFQYIHPGGSRIIKAYSGQDATEVFNAFHKELNRVNKYSNLYHIGRVDPNESSSHSNNMTQLTAIVNFQKDREIRADFQEVRQMALEKVSITKFFLYLRFQVI